MKLMEMLMFWSKVEQDMDQSESTSALRQEYQKHKDAIRAAVHEENDVPNDGLHDDDILTKANEIELKLGSKSRRAYQEMRIFLASHEERLFPTLAHESETRRVP